MDDVVIFLLISIRRIVELFITIMTIVLYTVENSHLVLGCASNVIQDD